jgi:hypothetical protein
MCKMQIMAPTQRSTSNTRQSTGIYNQPQSIIVNEFKSDVHPTECTTIYAEEDQPFYDFHGMDNKS